jgi:THO complex subunit 2
MSLYDKWHLILGTTFIGCVNSKEYMHNRTGLILLTRLVNNFPTKSTLGEKLLEELQPLQDDSNPLHDIKAMAQAYSAQLSKARSDGVWKEENKKAAKEREIKEKQIQEEKRIQREKNLEEMQKESKDIDKQLGRETRPGRPHSQMTPQQSRVGERNTVPQRDNRGQRDQRQSDRSPPPSQQSMQGRWEKDNGVAQRGHDQGRRRDEGRGENRNQTAGDNDSTKSSLRGRWDNSRKRERSPDKNKSERDVKRSRRDASPQPQHRGLRRGRR